MWNVECHYNVECRMWNVEWAAPDSDSKDLKDFPVEYHKEGEISRLPLLVKP